MKTDQKHPTQVIFAPTPMSMLYKNMVIIQNQLVYGFIDLVSGRGLIPHWSDYFYYI